MKLDKIKFAQVVAFICKTAGSMGTYDIEELDHLIDVDVPEPASCADVDNLLMLMNESTKKIEAIKAYRILTGAGLKEGKDAVEKYWILY